MSLEIYDFLRLIFITFIIALVVISFIIFMQRNRNKIVNGFTVCLITILSISVSGIALIVMGYIADEIETGGDTFSSFLFLIILVLNIINGLIYYLYKMKKS